MGYLKSLTVLLFWCRVPVICRGQGGRLALVLPSLDTSQEHPLTSSVVPPMRSMFVELVSDLTFSLFPLCLLSWLELSSSVSDYGRGAKR